MIVQGKGIGYVVTIFTVVLLFGCSDEADDDSLDILRSLPYTSGTASSSESRSGVVFLDEDRTCAGYRLFTAPQLGVAEMIDIYGNTVHSWISTENEYWARSVLNQDGELLVIGRYPLGNPQEGIADSTRFVQLLDWNGNSVWRTFIPVHHDLDFLPDGRIALLAFRRRLVPEIHPSIDLRDDCILILNPGNEKPDTAHYFLEAIDNSLSSYPLIDIQPSALGGSPWIDLFHSNSIEWITNRTDILDDPRFENADILVCFRHQDRVAMFDLDNQVVTWAWGGTECISGPHDASLLDSGNILLFDNGLGRKRSRVIEVNPLTDQIEWEYTADPPESFYTQSKGSAQRLPNGNTLLAESDNGRAIEVSPDGEIVWEYICPYALSDGRRSAIVRMTWYPVEMVNPWILTSD
ncbi:MAG: hypothetical protein GF388_10695 [Candidatus Aegiribacteria sp.]|nr:hypothetical protein [Candidatus Aegiribacteria sp.]